MSTEIQNYFILEKLKIARCKEEYQDSSIAKAIIKHIIINLLMKDILYLSLSLFPLDVFLQNVFCPFNKLLNLYEFNAYCVLSFIIFTAGISSSNDLSTFKVSNTFYLCGFQFDYFHLRFTDFYIIFFIYIISLNLKFNIFLYLFVLYFDNYSIHRSYFLRKIFRLFYKIGKDWKGLI